MSVALLEPVVAAVGQYSQNTPQVGVDG